MRRFSISGQLETSRVAVAMLPSLLTAKLSFQSFQRMAFRLPPSK
jgi:hypothetical protein